MSFTEAGDTLILFLLGLVGWGLFSRLRLPVAPLLGTLAILTTLRALGWEIPMSPEWLFPLLQVLLGVYVGSKVTREAVQNLKPMISSAVIIVLWAQAVVFLMGPLLAWMTTLDLYTALLSSSMGGLPEMTMIALATRADLGFIIMMQLVRMIATIAVFPFIFKKWVVEKANNDFTLNSNAPDHHRNTASNPGSNSHEAKTTEPNQVLDNNSPGNSNKRTEEERGKLILKKNIKEYFSYLTANILPQLYKTPRPAARGIMVLLIASGGGAALHFLGVPAGIMIGATLAVGASSLAGVKPFTIPAPMFNLMLAGLGIAVSDNIMPEKFAELTDPGLLAPVIIATVLIFISSLLVSLLVHRISGWDLPTSFLAAAPGGFSVMVALAAKYDKDPFMVSMLHLCRLLSIKIVVPFVFMYLT